MIEVEHQLPKEVAHLVQLTVGRQVQNLYARVPQRAVLGLKSLK